MPDSPSPRITRRSLLLGLALTTGCSAVRGAGGGGSGSSSPLGPGSADATPATPDPQLAAMLSAEQDMADWLAGLPLMQAASIPAATGTVLASLRDAHRAHAQALAEQLAQQQGTATPRPSSSVAKTKGTWAQLKPQLVRREQALAAQHRAQVGSAESPSAALLAASLATFATAAATATVPAVASKKAPGDVGTPQRGQELQVLLSRVRALAEGLRVGIGQLDGNDAMSTAGKQRLAAVLDLRDQLGQQIVAEKADVPPAQIGYRMPGTFTTAADTRRTWGALESAVLDGWGGVVAASSGAQRSAALDQMVKQAAAVAAQGTGIGWWPGWV